MNLKQLSVFKAVMNAGSTIAAGDAELGASVAFMQGKLKSTGSTGVLLVALSNGSAAAAISRLASRP